MKKVQSVISLKNLNISDVNTYKIVVIGVGGTGSLFLNGLARLSESLRQVSNQSFHVRAYDPDTFAEHNTGRQGNYPADDGENKAKVIIERINECYGYAWEWKDEKFPILDKLKDIDLIVCCVDNIRTRVTLMKQPLNILDIGNGSNYGQIILSSYDKKLPTTEELFGISLLSEDDAPSCSAIESLSKQRTFVNSWAAIAALQMLEELFIGKLLNYTQIYFKLNPLTIKTKFHYEN